MKKRILIAGCSHCLREYITNGLYYLEKGYFLTRLYKKYEVYNLSKKNLTVKEAIVLVEAFINKMEFDGIFLALGEGDIINNVDVNTFKNDLNHLIELCNSKNISIVLHNEVKKINKDYSHVIDSLQKENNFSYKVVSNKIVKA